MRDYCLAITSKLSGQIKCNGRRLSTKAVVSVMPMVIAKAKPKIAAIFFMAASLLQPC